jgi:hypothetical protein
MSQFGAGVAAPIILVNEDKHFKHGPNIARMPTRKA